MLCQDQHPGGRRSWGRWHPGERPQGHSVQGEPQKQSAAREQQQQRAVLRLCEAAQSSGWLRWRPQLIHGWSGTSPVGFSSWPHPQVTRSAHAELQDAFPGDDKPVPAVALHFQLVPINEVSPTAAPSRPLLPTPHPPARLSQPLSPDEGAQIPKDGLEEENPAPNPKFQPSGSAAQVPARREAPKLSTAPVTQMLLQHSEEQPCSAREAGRDLVQGVSCSKPISRGRAVEGGLQLSGFPWSCLTPLQP